MVTNSEAAESSAERRLDGSHRADLPETLTWEQVRRPLFRSALAMGALVCAGLVGMWSTHPTSPGDNSIEAGFARDMAAHHSQAVTLSFTALNNTASPEVRDLARSIVTDESADVGAMNGWLRSWGLPERPNGARMEWMRRTGHLHAGLPPGATLLPDGRMPGTASNHQVAQLNGLRGRPAEVLYLQLMRLHDTASIQMASAVEGASDRTDVVRLASDDITRDKKQLTQITTMLADRGATPWTSAQAGQPVVRT